MKTFKEKLKSKNIKPTYQRLKVLEYLHKNQVHPTVDMIYQELVKEIPTMSKTTVYNTLNMLAKEGVVSCVTITGKETRFDGMVTSNHHHFLCEECGTIIDIDITCPVFARKEIQGHIAKEFHGYFKGICKECKKKTAKNAT